MVVTGFFVLYIYIKDRKIKCIYHNGMLMNIQESAVKFCDHNTCMCHSFLEYNSSHHFIYTPQHSFQQTKYKYKCEMIGME